jgi:hypothetical protein
MKKLTGLMAVLACLTFGSPCFADSFTTFDLETNIDSAFSFTGTFTYDLSTKLLTDAQIFDGGGLLPTTVLAAPAFGTQGNFDLSLYFGAPGQNQATEFHPLSFGIDAPLGSAAVIRLTGESFIQSPNVTGIFDCANNPQIFCGGTLTQGPVTAPEIDPNSAGSALILLLGLIAVARGRRVSQPIAA